MEKVIFKEMQELIQRLNQASKAYYQEDKEIMSNKEYDDLYDRLEELEKKTGTILAGSPTVHVGYESLDILPKETHESPMLSLDKTKEVESLREFIGDRKSLISWKMDGLTIVLIYENGILQKAVTRGNGTVGEVITNNARVFSNIPLSIPHKGRIVLRGEAIITYSDFKKINETIEDVDAKYKNPRNLCSGSVRQLNNKITAERNVRFYAFSLVSAEGVGFDNSHEKEMLWLQKQGFQIVEYKAVTKDTLDTAMGYFRKAVETNDFPSDGLVVLYDDIAYGVSLGRTAKFPRNAIAFKWADETAVTHLLEIEWSPSRTGLINPVAVFEPVELEGTTVSRASVHNISIVKELKLGIGDEITVYKANMIIPQIAENLTKSSRLEIPSVCPACGGEAVIKQENDVESLYCPNPECSAKKIKSFALFASRDAMNIDGLSEATLEKLAAKGFLHSISDLFCLAQHEQQITALEGFGKKSYENLIQSLEKAKHTTLPRLLYGLGISGVGVANAKMLAAHFDNELQQIRTADVETLGEIEGIGPVLADSIWKYFRDEEKQKQLDELLKYIEIAKEKQQRGKALEGLTFVITGSVEHFANRSQLKEKIEELGGKATGTVTGKTSYLINNDTASKSSKNKKAMELGVPIISEEEFIKMMEE